jgi:TRAP-type mannitol/chloroaromatic compound transport system permease small subunit
MYAMKFFLLFIEGVGNYLKQIWFYLSRARFCGCSSEYSYYAYGTCFFILPFLNNLKYKINIFLNMFRFYEVSEIYKTENKIIGGLQNDSK